MRVAALLVGAVVAFVPGAAPEARAQAAVAYGVVTASSAASSVSASKVYRVTPRSVSGKTAVARSMQPAASGVRTRGARRSAPPGQSLQSATVSGASARTVGGGMTVVGEQSKDAQPQE